MNCETTQQRAPNLRDRQIHLAAGIFKNAQANRLLDQVIRRSARISRAHPKQHQQAEADFARGFAIHSNSGAAHALHYGAHSAAGLAEKRLVSGERLLNSKQDLHAQIVT